MKDWFHGDNEHDYGAPALDKLTRCYEAHPALPLGTYAIYGGSCIHPAVNDANIYVGLDRGMASGLVFPWQGGIEVCYPITDMAAPKNPETFKQLVTWISNQLDAGKKIHVGCIGGHGRTGTLLAALARVVLDEEDAITYVREQYCTHAVESAEQVRFLHTHFGIKKVKGYKEFSGDVRGYGKHYDPKEYDKHYEPTPHKSQVTPHGSVKTYEYGKSGKYSSTPSKSYTLIEPAPSPRNIWRMP